MYEYEATLIDLINSAIRAIRILPLVLGGTSDSGGGSGGPPGGFVGYLPQGQVAYDTDEFADSSTPVSGMSILDNLNHIRYRIENLETIPSDLDTDHEVAGIKTNLIAGTALVFGEVCRMGSDSKMEKTDASSYDTCGGWAMVAEDSVAENGDGEFLLTGFARNDSWNFTNPGKYVYTDSVTPGGITQTPTSGTGDTIQILGVAISSKRVYFNPNLAQVEHA